MMNDIINSLSKFGEVKTCKIVKDNFVTVVITSGFSTTKSLQLLNECQSMFADYPNMETCVMEDNLVILILSN